MGKAIMGIAKLLDYLWGIPLIGEKTGQGAKEVQSWADGVRESGQANRDYRGRTFCGATVSGSQGFTRVSSCGEYRVFYLSKTLSLSCSLTTS